MVRLFGSNRFESSRFREKNDAVRKLQIRQNIAGNRELSRGFEDPGVPGKEAIDAALCRRIDGRPLRDVLQLGLEFRVLRLQQELAGLENAVKQNAQLVTRPGDVAVPTR